MTATRSSRGHERRGGCARKEDKQAGGKELMEKKRQTGSFLWRTLQELVISERLIESWTMFVRVKTIRRHPNNNYCDFRRAN